MARGSTADVENVLSEMFRGGSPVVLSSGRIGLVLALETLGIRRADNVALFPYASHCVIEAVGRVGSPVRSDSAEAILCRVLYHQWGYVQERAVTDRVIEDAVDSFCVRGASLFPAGGDFEVWSLSKLLGCLGGGVLWCRDAAVAAEMRDRRDSRNALTSLRWLLRVLSRSWPRLVPFWYGAESLGGAPPRWACSDIRSALREWDRMATERRERLGLVRDLLPSWLVPDEDRLPSVVPVIASEEQGRALSALGFSASFRHFERIESNGTRSVVRMFPIPVHQDVPISILDEARRIMAGSPVCT
jgi:putative PLP-dependent aminotransferase (TIGR04422 family)